ncbi:MAG: hypothetical protein A3C85_04785 [Candidatus Doudnabacteria bacterium RIFCSPHIGHO2_02_FULL_48_21]|uniref:EF-hand domain-containing protein n=1 Tax=Candidatus Doudnabacteria bacterium RIFCSPLOWO2_02_FULL_48_13 TaxID=1817845 RepID=A0A1F5QCI1_9BACT|nr:MAG: hypothetical protein A3K05_02300 [Candidatus Doudnabacteria bacterium RIFCSPHIGHO2_01_48_18]OGE90953.1 MAG: hypothetical protein A3F44_03545 [Candidatus Doudnabacteria bacterium RIFCSPHIGHO2_12_FULL_47_25]OGE92820.1 MAG: hypothetical protein A3C85_04785 [Candidatus Doudnabacteria bacterium RIFCSPHIGHO2_02_FULL_48_21]OGE98133.1 MAG: hypothetical protein A3A83_00680 [Candidatus Doudnabacteria bacterium RIFCSPLOWO2_01_FULL_48_57]OGE99894.1 MAG: hypothetical protein A3J05_03535 [Candidatus 
MPLIPSELLFRGGNVPKFRKFFIPIGIFIIALATASAFYFFSKNAGNADNQTANSTGPRTLPKSWLVKYFLTEDENAPHVGGPASDPDNDVLSNYLEYMYGTDPTKEDTDNDGEIDSFEVAFGRNPNGEGMLALGASQKDLIKDYIASSEKLSDFTEEKVLGEIQEMFNPDQQVALDLPQDREIILTKQNDVPAFEKYYNETKDLTAVAEDEGGAIAQRLFDNMTDEEINVYIARLEAAQQTLLQTPVPAQIVNIHKLKIAGLRAGIKLFELARDNYQPGVEDKQFWSDIFSQMVAIQQSEDLELATWRELGLKLKDTGGI